MGKFRVVLSGSVAVAAAVTAGGQAGAAGAAAGAPVPKFGLMYSVSASSARDVWAVGRDQRGRTMILHSGGKIWRRQAIAAADQIVPLVSVSAVSARLAWAAGLGVILRWNGVSWQRARLPEVGRRAFFDHVVAVSAADAWAAGSYDVRGDPPTRAVLLHWDGTSWRQAPIPGRIGDLSVLGASSAGNAWAMGENGPLGPWVALHWDGSRWRRAPAPQAVSGFAAAVVSERNAWMVGQSRNLDVLIEHWNGIRWRRAKTAGPLPGGLDAAEVVSARDIWAVGDVIMRYRGTGWNQVPSTSPGLLTGVTATSASNAWAVGFDQISHNLSKIIILHWNGRGWWNVHPWR